MLEPVADLLDDGERHLIRRPRESPLVDELQQAAACERHRVPPLGDVRFEDRHDIRVVELLLDLDLALQARDALLGLAQAALERHRVPVPSRRSARKTSA
jgi:hypothetical protein